MSIFISNDLDTDIDIETHDNPHLTPAAKLYRKVIIHLYMKNLVTKRDKGQREKLSYPRENIDNRQENTIPLPFLCKMRYIKRVHRILKTNGSGIVFSCLSSMFSRG